jgi:hypothetical protein
MTEPKRTKRAKPDPELLKLADSLLANYQKPEDLIGENGLLKQLTKMLVERALEAEMAEHLGHDKGATVTNVTGNAAMGTAARLSRGTLASCRSTSRVTAKALLSRSWSPNIKPVGPASTIKSSPCMPED